MKALSPAKVKEVRIHEDTGTAEVIVPDYQLSLAIGKEGQNARLAARLTGWRVDIKSETQLAEEEAYNDQDWAEGEWVVDPETGEQVWQPAEGGEAMSAEAYAQASAEDQEAEGDDVAEADSRRAGADGEAVEAERRRRDAAEDAAAEASKRRRGVATPADEASAETVADGARSSMAAEEADRADAATVADDAARAARDPA